MIQLQTLAKNINDGLNAKLAGGLLSTPRGRYEFFVVADTADYKKADREGNTVTYYINGNLIVTSSNVESTQAGSLNATIGTRLDLLVPVIDGSDEDGNKELVATVRNILDEYFSSNGSGEMEGYYYGYQYNIAISGGRNNFPMLGDGFVFSIDITYYFIENGVSSNAIILKIDGETVDYLTLGISRSTTQESDTPSDTNNGAAENVDLASMLGINFTMPLLRTVYCKKMCAYLLGARKIGKLINVEMSVPVVEEDVPEISASALNAAIYFRTSRPFDGVVQVTGYYEYTDNTGVKNTPFILELDGAEFVNNVFTYQPQDFYYTISSVTLYDVAWVDSGFSGTETFSMSIQDARLNAESALNASLSVTLTEAMT